MKKAATPLRLAREWRGLTIRQVREVTGIATGRLSMMERDMVRPHESELKRLSDALATPAEQLFPALSAWPDLVGASFPPPIESTGT